MKRCVALLGTEALHLGVLRLSGLPVCSLLPERSTWAFCCRSSEVSASIVCTPVDLIG